MLPDDRLSGVAGGRRAFFDPKGDLTRCLA